MYSCTRARARVYVCVCVCEHEYQEQVICVRLVFRRSTATTVSVLFQFWPTHQVLCTTNGLLAETFFWSAWSDSLGSWRFMPGEPLGIISGLLIGYNNVRVNEIKVLHYRADTSATLETTQGDDNCITGFQKHGNSWLGALTCGSQ